MASKAYCWRDAHDTSTWHVGFVYEPTPSMYHAFSCFADCLSDLIGNAAFEALEARASDRKIPITLTIAIRDEEPSDATD